MVPSLSTLHPAFVWEEETRNPVNTVLNRGVEWRGAGIEGKTIQGGRKERREREGERSHSGKLLTTTTKKCHFLKKKKKCLAKLSSSLIWKVKSLAGRQGADAKPGFWPSHAGHA